MKKLLAIVLAVLMIAALAACGDGASNPSSQESTPSAGGDKKVLTFYGFSEWVDSAPWKEFYEAAVKQFEDENPGFTVDLQSDPWGEWETKYVSMFAAGNPADVYFVNNPEVAQFANGGHMLNISDYVDAGYFNNFFPGVASMYTWKGANVAIPFTTDCRMMWYNKDLFTEAGLDPDAPPTTWAELVTMANQIKEKTGKAGFGMDLGLKEFPQQGLFCASAGSIINVAGDGTVTPNVDTAEFKGYLQTLVDMKGAYHDDFSIQDHHTVAEQYVAGEFGIIIGNTLDSDTTNAIRETDWYGQALIPSIDGKTNGSFGGGFGIGVSAKTEYPEQAVKFAQILCSADFCAKLISDIPASEAGLAKCDKVSDPTYDVYFEQIKYARQAQPKTLFYKEIDMAVYETIVSALVNNKSVDDAVADLAAKITDIAK